MGAAILTENGEIYTGCNVENVSYGLTQCAERVAVGKAVSEGASGIRAVALAAEPGAGAAPCGACRQVLAEFNPGMIVITEDKEGGLRKRSLADLFPDPFLPSALKRNGVRK